MDCARNLSSLYWKSVDCDCRVQYLSGSLCHSSCISTLFVQRVQKWLLLFVVSFYRTTISSYLQNKKGVFLLTTKVDENSGDDDDSDDVGER